MNEPTGDAPIILVLGTADTKADEISFIKECLEAGGAKASIMDVGVLGEAPMAVDFSKHDVARAAGTTNQAIAALGDENLAMAKTAMAAAMDMDLGRALRYSYIGREILSSKEGARSFTQKQPPPHTRV